MSGMWAEALRDRFDQLRSPTPVNRPPTATDTGLAGSVRSRAAKACLCCEQALSDGRLTRLCNRCFHGLARHGDNSNGLRCSVHNRNVDPTVTGGW